MTNVLFLVNCPSPYRVEFFNELSKYVELTVLYEMQKIESRSDKWKSSEKDRYKAIYLKSRFKKEEGTFCPEIKRFLNKFKEDVIIIGGYSTPTGMYAISYLKSHRIPFALNCDGGFVKKDSHIKRRIKTFFIESATWWLSSGKNGTKYLMHYGADANKIYEYPFSSVRASEITDVTEIRRGYIRKRLGIGEKKVVLFVGRFIECKGIDTLLNACVNFKEIALVLVGGNDISQFMPADGKKLKCHVYIEEFKNECELKEYYQAADVFVLPTKGDVWGLVVNEAMANGLPVITTDQCGAGLDMIENGENGYIVPANDERKLENAIDKLLNDEALCKLMSENNIKKARAYTIEEMAYQHKNIIERIKNEQNSVRGADYA